MGAGQDEPAVRVSGVTRVFPGGLRALEGVSLNIRQGEFVALVGPSGCGKSTLLRMLAGLDRPTEGEIGVAEHQRVGFVFQDAHLLPWRDVLGNVALPLELMGIGKRQRLERASDLILQVGLSGFERARPSELSGGMKMRVSLARALVTEPRLLLMDEPFAALDEITRQRLDERLRALWLARGFTVVFVTHSISEATFLSERAVVMSARPGSIVGERAIDLGRERIGSLRGEARFAEASRDLFELLERGERLRAV